MFEVLTPIATGLTFLLVLLIYYFNFAYRRATGDTSVPYVSWDRWRPIALILRRHTDPRLRGLQRLAIVVGFLWLLSVLALFLAFGTVQVN